MKMFYSVLVGEGFVSRMESLLNALRIGLNDWDKSKVFEYNGARLINYTIVCTAETYETIVNYLYEN